MSKVNEAYMVSFIIDKKSNESAITIIKAHPDGKLEAIKRIEGKKSEKIYDLIFEDGN